MREREEQKSWRKGEKVMGEAKEHHFVTRFPGLGTVSVKVKTPLIASSGLSQGQCPILVN
jgi:hypothetical protein